MAIPISTPIKRQIHLYGLDSPINIILHPHGIEMTVAGARTKVFASWEHVAKNMLLPDSVPSIYHSRPFEFLKHLASKIKKGKI